MAKEETLSLDGYYSHEGKVLEPGKTYLVVENPTGDNQISKFAAENLTDQMARIQAAKDEQTRLEEEQRRQMYGNEGVPGSPTVHAPAGLSMEDVSRMIQEALDQKNAELSAANSNDENSGENTNETNDENANENNGSNENQTGTGEEANAKPTGRTLNTGNK